MSAEQSFWARRKAAVAAAEEAERTAADDTALEQPDAAWDGKSDAEILADLNLPEPETLKEGDDFLVFLAKTVPEHIRRRALRVLWRSNPVLANVDMLVDYGEDFTDKATVVPDIQTAYQVGKGMLRHVEELARQMEPDGENDMAPDGDRAGEELMATHDAPVQHGEQQPMQQAEPETVAPTHEDERPFVAAGETGAEPVIGELKERVIMPQRMRFRDEVST